MTKDTAVESVQPESITPRLLTVKQAAAYLNATVWAIRQMIWNDLVPHIVIGKKQLIDRGDLDRYVDIQLSNSARDSKKAASRIARTVQHAVSRP